MRTPTLIAAALLALTLGACSEQNSSAPSTSAPAPAATASAPAPAPVAEHKEGEGIYKRVCALCHAAGVAGAPIPGNKDDWESRVAQGMDTLYTHSIEGFTGDHGMMPARGGSPALTDDEMKAAVDYMVAQLQ